MCLGRLTLTQGSLCCLKLLKIMSCFHSALLPPVAGRMPWKPSHISPQVCDTGAALREVQMSLALLAGTWTVFPQVSDCAQTQMNGQNVQPCSAAPKTRDRWSKVGKQMGTAEPVQPKDTPNPVFCLQLFSGFFYSFLFLCSSVRPGFGASPASPRVHPRAHPWQCPKQLWHREAEQSWP